MLDESADHRVPLADQFLCRASEPDRDLPVCLHRGSENLEELDAARLMASHAVLRDVLRERQIGIIRVTCDAELGRGRDPLKEFRELHRPLAERPHERPIHFVIREKEGLLEILVRLIRVLRNDEAAAGRPGIAAPILHLLDHENLCPGVMRRDRCGTARSAVADHEDIGFGVPVSLRFRLRVSREQR